METLTTIAVFYTIATALGFAMAMLANATASARTPHTDSSERGRLSLAPHVRERI